MRGCPNKIRMQVLLPGDGEKAQVYGEGLLDPEAEKELSAVSGEDLTYTRADIETAMAEGIQWQGPPKKMMDPRWNKQLAPQKYRETKGEDQLIVIATPRDLCIENHAMASTRTVAVFSR